ncbi:MAG: hypothetical protein AAF598_14565 [Bacteroidota bacterium]
MSKKKKKDQPKVHEELKGFEIKINEFGEIVSNTDVDKLNTFLDKNVDDKKLRDLKPDEPLETEEEEPDFDDLDPSEMEDDPQV